MNYLINTGHNISNIRNFPLDRNLSSEKLLDFLNSSSFICKPDIWIDNHCFTIHKLFNEKKIDLNELVKNVGINNAFALLVLCYRRASLCSKEKFDAFPWCDVVKNFGTLLKQLVNEHFEHYHLLNLSTLKFSTATIEPFFLKKLETGREKLSTLSKIRNIATRSLPHVAIAMTGVAAVIAGIALTAQKNSIEFQHNAPLAFNNKSISQGKQEESNSNNNERKQEEINFTNLNECIFKNDFNILEKEVKCSSFKQSDPKKYFLNLLATSNNVFFSSALEFSKQCFEPRYEKTPTCQELTKDLWVWKELLKKDAESAAEYATECIKSSASARSWVCKQLYSLSSECKLENPERNVAEAETVAFCALMSSPNQGEEVNPIYKNKRFKYKWQEAYAKTCTYNSCSHLIDPFCKRHKIDNIKNPCKEGIIDIHSFAASAKI